MNRSITLTIETPCFFRCFIHLKRYFRGLKCYFVSQRQILVCKNRYYSIRICFRQIMIIIVFIKKLKAKKRMKYVYIGPLKTLFSALFYRVQRFCAALVVRVASRCVTTYQKGGSRFKVTACFLLSCSSLIWLISTNKYFYEGC